MKRISFFIKSLGLSKTIAIIALIAVIIAVPLTVFISQKQQEIRQRAFFEEQAALYFTLSEQNPLNSLNIDNPSPIEISMFLETKQNPVNGFDIIINFGPLITVSNSFEEGSGALQFNTLIYKTFENNSLHFAKVSTDTSKIINGKLLLGKFLVSGIQQGSGTIEIPQAFVTSPLSSSYLTVRRIPLSFTIGSFPTGTIKPSTIIPTIGISSPPSQDYCNVSCSSSNPCQYPLTCVDNGTGSSFCRNPRCETEEDCICFDPQISGYPTDKPRPTDIIATLYPSINPSGIPKPTNILPSLSPRPTRPDVSPPIGGTCSSEGQLCKTGGINIQDCCPGLTCELSLNLIGICKSSEGSPSPTEKPYPTTKPSIYITPYITDKPSIPPVTGYITIKPSITPAVTSYITLKPSPTGTPGPAGNIFLSLDLLLPGIGAVRGNTNPVHQEREVTACVYDPLVNFAGDYTCSKALIKTTGFVYYDDASGTFTNNNFDLGPLKSGQYKVLIKMAQYLRKAIPQIINVKEGDVNLTPQTSLVTGDINNDNLLNIADYNIYISCFGSKANTSSCIDKESVDLNDDGQTDSPTNLSDYRLLFSSFQTQQGD